MDYEDMLKGYKVLSISEIRHEREDDVLFVIGNGFDLMHGAKASYYDFGKTLGKHSNLRHTLEFYLKADDLWADFEGALAKINVEVMCSSHIIDMRLRDMGAYDEDAGSAEFFLAAEMAAAPMNTLNTELMQRFRKWVESLNTNTEDRPFLHIFETGRILTFNYTEFVETLYGVSEDNICYIHGTRKKRKGHTREELILGHIPGASDEFFEFKDNFRGIDLSEGKAQMVYDAQETAIRFVAEADDNLTKHCDKIIKKNDSFFASLENVDKVITIGHSLYPVDWDYFKEIINRNKKPSDIEWIFGCYGKGDLERIESFARAFDIDVSHVSVFRTDKIKLNIRHSDDKEINISREPKEKVIGQVGEGRYSVVTYKNKTFIRDNFAKSEENIVLLPLLANRIICLDTFSFLLVVRGINAGVFLVRFYDEKWECIAELEPIPNQRLINNRLNKVLLDGTELVFLYNNRIRKYDIETGKMILNKAVRDARNIVFSGDGIKRIL